MEIRFSMLDKRLYNANDECIDVIRDVFFHAEKGTISFFLGEKQKYHANSILCNPTSLVYYGVQEHDGERTGGVSILQKKVFTRTKKYLGRVIDLVIDGMFKNLLSLTVEKKYFSFFSQRREISSTWIEEIQKDAIIVREDVGEEKEKARKTLIEILPA
jgi:sporulation protein YlmC with PRC-barrel domain